jgi:hypothetical protein
MLVPFNRYRYILKGVWRIQGINLLGVDICLVSALWLRLSIYDKLDLPHYWETNAKTLRFL